MKLTLNEFFKNNVKYIFKIKRYEDLNIDLL